MTAPLSTYGTDELVDEVRVRLNDGVLGYKGLLSTNQADHDSMWQEMFSWISAQVLADPDNETIKALRVEFLRITDEHTPKGVFAVNTTFFGRSAFEDHAPKPYLAEAAE